MATSTKISQKIHNYNYAPGIATYGIDGKTGEAGLNGNNIFYTNYNIDTEKESISTLIKNNYLPLKGANTVLSRKYQNGDYFVDINGTLWKLIDIDQLVEDDMLLGTYFTIVGQIKIDNPEIGDIINNRLLLKKDTYNGIDILSGLNEFNFNDKVAMNIASNVVDENSNINFILLSGINSNAINDGELIIYYNTLDGAYHLSANNPILIDSDLKVNNDNSEIVYDEYSTILTSNDPITLFKHMCDKLIYNVYYDTEDRQYKLSIFSKDDSLSNEEKENLLKWFLKNNMYIKVYDINGQLALLPLNIINDNYEQTTTKLLDLSNVLDQSSLTKRNVTVVLDDTTTFTIGDSFIDYSINEINNEITYNIKSNSNDYVLNNSLRFNLKLQEDINEYYNYNYNKNTKTIEKNNILKTNTNSNVYYKDGTYEIKFIYENNTITFDTFFGINNIYPNTENQLHGFSPIFDLSNNSELHEGDVCTLSFNVIIDKNGLNINNIKLFKETTTTVDGISITQALPNNIENVSKVSILYNTEIFIDKL